MKFKFLALMVVSLFVACGVVFADDEKVYKELHELVSKVNTKIRAGQPSEEYLKDELKEFDTLFEKYKSEKTAAVGSILEMKALLYLQVLNNQAKAEEILEVVAKDFPDSSYAKFKKMESSLVMGGKFPDFDEKDINGKAMSVAGLKGKVVLVDFWATWCPPCVADMPDIVKTYDKHHSQGFEVLGISLDEEKEKLTAFESKHKMKWQQYFDGKVWDNKLAKTYLVHSIPMTYLLDREGTIIGLNLRGEEIEKAVEKAIEKK